MNPLRYMNVAQIDAALQAAGYCDNKLSAVNYVGRSADGGFTRDDDAVASSAAYVYEICFYDDNEGRLTLGYVYVTQTDGEPVAEFGTTNITLEEAT